MTDYSTRMMKGLDGQTFILERSMFFMIDFMSVYLTDNAYILQ